MTMTGRSCRDGAHMASLAPEHVQMLPHAHKSSDMEVLFGACPVYMPVV